MLCIEAGGLRVVLTVTTHIDVVAPSNVWMVSVLFDICFFAIFVVKSVESRETKRTCESARQFYVFKGALQFIPTTLPCGSTTLPHHPTTPLPALLRPLCGSNRPKVV